MLIFVRHLPRTTTRRELRDFIQEAIQRSWGWPIGQKSRIAKCDIVQITDRGTDLTEFHGLVHIQPAKAALSAIQRLNGASFKGKPVEVRKYIHRSPLRDNRKTGDWFLEEIENPERRKRDRRRPSLSIDLAVGSGRSISQLFRALQSY